MPSEDTKILDRTLAKLRRDQDSRVMPVVGALLEFWEMMPNDEKDLVRTNSRLACLLDELDAAVEGDGLGEIMELHGLDTETQVCFYEQDFYCLSNFSAFRVQWRGRDFDTSEAAYHWERFATGQEGQSPAIGAMAWRVADEIRFTPSAHLAFKLAQANKGFQRPDWDEVKLGVMKQILRAKAAQHDYVRRKLLATDDRELVENSWRDDFWGRGPNRDGKNMLGKLWMEVRAELRGEQNV